jgi:hypothetical protein
MANIYTTLRTLSCNHIWYIMEKKFVKISFSILIRDELNKNF